MACQYGVFFLSLILSDLEHHEFCHRYLKDTRCSTQFNYRKNKHMVSDYAEILLIIFLQLWKNCQTFLKIQNNAFKRALYAEYIMHDTFSRWEFNMFLQSGKYVGSTFRSAAPQCVMPWKWTWLDFQTLCCINLLLMEPIDSGLPKLLGELGSELEDVMFKT